MACLRCPSAATHFEWCSAGRSPRDLRKVCLPCARKREKREGFGYYFAPFTHAATIADEFDWSPEERALLRSVMA